LAWRELFYPPGDRRLRRLNAHLCLARAPERVGHAGQDSGPTNRGWPWWNLQSLPALRAVPLTPTIGVGGDHLCAAHGTFKANHFTILSVVSSM
jgi:hypothetical protein